jgi:hypothetical protein
MVKPLSLRTHDEGGSVSSEPNKINRDRAEEEHILTEQIEIAASELVERTKELIAEGNVRRLIIRNQDDEVLLEVPLTAGVAVGGVVTLVAPVLAALGALAALLTHVKVEIVRTRRNEKRRRGLVTRLPRSSLPSGATDDPETPAKGMPSIPLPS